MSLLDSPAEIAARDPSDTLGTLSRLSDQVRLAALAVARTGLEPAHSVRSVVICGMGSSANGGEVAAACAAAAGSVPVIIHRSYGVPAFVGPGTFVIASSYSGGTEETLDALAQARRRGAQGLAITCGGSLADEASRAGWPVVAVDPGVLPRFALGWMAAAPVAALETLGLVELPAGWVDDVVGTLERGAQVWGPHNPAAANPAKALAQVLVGADPVVWGADGAAGVAAQRWKNDLNENAKVFAHAACLPEVDHNEIVGWAAEGREGRPDVRRALICLREAGEDPRIGVRFDHTLAEVASDFDIIQQFTASGAHPVVRFFDLALLGGFVSVYLAIARQIDPNPIEAIFRLKAALAAGT